MNLTRSQTSTSQNWLESLAFRVAEKLQLDRVQIAERIIKDGRPILVDQAGQVIEPKNISRASGFFVLSDITRDETKEFPGKGHVYDVRFNVILSRSGPCPIGWWLHYTQLLRGKSLQAEGISSFEMKTKAVVSDTLTNIGIYFPAFQDQLASFGSRLQIATIELELKVYGCKPLTYLQ